MTQEPRVLETTGDWSRNDTRALYKLACEPDTGAPPPVSASRRLRVLALDVPDVQYSAH